MPPRPDPVIEPHRVLTDTGEVAAFGVAARRPPAAAEILWIAVDPPRRGRGLGTVLLDRVLEDLAVGEVSVVVAKTLDRSAGYPPYEATRAFWENRGFVQVDTIDPFPGWQPGNPAAIYIAALRATRPPAPGQPVLRVPGGHRPVGSHANNGGYARVPCRDRPARPISIFPPFWPRGRLPGWSAEDLRCRSNRPTGTRCRRRQWVWPGHRRARRMAIGSPGCSSALLGAAGGLASVV
jgi:hypothetical protein